MIITIVGITGNLGKELVKEGLKRGHILRGIAPDVDVVKLDKRVTMYKGKANDTELMVTSFRGSDVVVTIFPPSLKEPGKYKDELKNVFCAVKKSGVKRLIGIAGSSGALVNTGERLVNTDYFQETTRHFYLNVCDSWNLYRRKRIWIGWQWYQLPVCRCI